MITEKEIQAASLSTTKKDFYQIWNELLDTAGKISERWDPSSTNESDPGIVLLKVLTGIADKLNYNIDKNTLEAFMPSATQEDSMRKLCEMMGYNIKYYQSATTPATIAYTGEDKTVGSILIPQFTALTNVDNNVVYVTAEPCSLYVDTSSSNMTQISRKSVNCIEGSVMECKTDSNNLVTLSYLDDNYRYYLPESSIAENGIYVYKATEGITKRWTQVNNLNTVSSGVNAYKLGFDSKKRLPYLQFPEDIGALIGDGLTIKYIQTSGANGNISAKTLTKLKDGGVVATKSDGTTTELAASNFTVSNASAASNGRNIESLDDAYNNYKKTIGTFDTLVTCRDYMNKIYQLVDDLDVPLVSNCIVSDIRDDINKAFTLCEFGENGILYTEHATTDDEGKELISHFDLILYPFKTVYGLNNEDEYQNSFNYNRDTKADIIYDLEDYKTISHKYNDPSTGDITCIKNYLKLSAVISTTYKVNAIEEEEILKSIYTTIYTKFNARQLDFGEEIPFDGILTAIESADERIKNVALNEPELITAIQVLTETTTGYGTKEYLVSSETTDLPTYKKLMNKLTLRNILAGRISMFNYDTKFKNFFTDSKYTGTGKVTPSGESKTFTYATEYPTADQEKEKFTIKTIETSCEIPVPITTTTDAEGNTSGGVKLTEGEVVSFRAPNFTTAVTYPAYVNYFMSYSGTSQPGTPATFQTFKTYLNTDDYVESFILTKELGDVMMTKTISGSYVGPKYTCIEYEQDKIIYQKFTRGATGTTDIYAVNLTTETFNDWSNWIEQQPSWEKAGVTLNGFYYRMASDRTRVIGEMVDKNYFKYNRAYQWHTASGYTALETFYVQQTSSGNNGLGKNSILSEIKKDCEYQLTGEEYLLFNYTENSTTNEGSTVKNVKNVVYRAGTIIRPNFDLADSKTKRNQGTIFTKTSGFNFDSQYQPEGMFTFDANQQIEIRNLAQVDLAGLDKDNKPTTPIANVYWYSPIDKRNEEFFLNGETEHVLEDNEYFLYTDQNKLEMAYYGSGCKIAKNGASQISLKKLSTDSKVDMKQILALGIQGIPWITLNNLSSEKNIIITEYQFVNLTSGDTVVNLALKDSSQKTLTNTYAQISGQPEFSYGASGTSSSLSLIAVPGAEWEVASKLSVDFGPNKEQTFVNTYDKLKVTLIKGTGETAETKVINDGAGHDWVGPHYEGNTVTPLALKSSYAVQTSASVIDIASVNDKLEDLGQQQFYLGVNKNTPIEKVTLNNFGTSGAWTSFNFSELPVDPITEKASVDLNISVPTGKYGLMLIYYITGANNISTNNAYLTTEATTGTAALTIYNNNNSWWTVSNDDDTKYYLRPGTNIVKIPENCKKLTIHKAESESEKDKHTNDAIIFSDLSIVNGINPTLDYNQIDKDTIEKQLCADILKYDKNHDFYYNAEIDNSTALEIGESSGEKITTPRIFYDYNNMNNKFVISEISVDAMKSGITIAKSSKLY